MKKLLSLAAVFFAAVSINAQTVKVLNEVANYIDFQALSEADPYMTSHTVTSTDPYVLPNGSILRGYHKEDGSEVANMWMVKETYNNTLPTPTWEGVDSLKVGTRWRAGAHSSIELGAFHTSAAGKLTIYYQPNGDSERGVEIYVYGELVEGTNLTGSGVKIDGLRPAYAGYIDLPAGSYDAGDVVIKLITNTSNICGVGIMELNEPNYIISTNVSPANSGAVNCVYNTATNAILTATPNNGYHFVQWSDGNTNNPRAIELTQDTTFTAEFAINQYSNMVLLPDVANYIDFQALSVFDPAMTQTTITSTNTYELPNGSILKGFLKSDGTEAENRWLVRGTYNTTLPTPTWEGVDSLIVGTGWRASSRSSIELGAFQITTDSKLTVYYQPNGDSERGVEVYVYGQPVEGTNLTGNGYKINGIRPAYAGEIDLPAGSYDAGDVVIKMITNTSNIFGVGIKEDNYQITTNVSPDNSGTVNYVYYTANYSTLTAVPNYGYHFVQWSDGNTDNPRTIAVNRDSTFIAEFAIDKSGTCGENNALIWSYEDQSKTLTITGDGALTENYTFGIEAPTQMHTLIIGDGVTAIGDSAFYNKSSIFHISIGANVASIGNYTFAECRNFDDITCYATIVPTINATTFANVGNKQYIYLYIPADRERAYRRDTYWSEFDVQIKSATTTTTITDEVTVAPTETTAAVTWPVVENAATYELTIKDSNGNVICTLIFNAQGQLTSIDFAAPSRAQRSTQSAGFSFTVIGLDSGSNYSFTIDAKDDSGEVIDTKSGTFDTTSEVQTDITNLNATAAPLKVLRNGQLFILRDGKTYTAQGQEVK